MQNKHKQISVHIFNNNNKKNTDFSSGYNGFMFSRLTKND